MFLHELSVSIFVQLYYPFAIYNDKNMSFLKYTIAIRNEYVVGGIKWEYLSLYFFITIILIEACLMNSTFKLINKL